MGISSQIGVDRSTIFFFTLYKFSQEVRDWNLSEIKIFLFYLYEKYEKHPESEEVMVSTHLEVPVTYIVDHITTRPSANNLRYMVVDDDKEGILLWICSYSLALGEAELRLVWSLSVLSSCLDKV